MDVITLEAQPRNAGKREARAARRQERVPCVLYGHNTEPVSFTVEELAMRQLIFTNETHRVNVEINGGSWECILKDVDFHPVSEYPIHADFQVLTEGEVLNLTIPVRYVGTPIGQTEGGDTQFVLTEVEVRCLPEDIPSRIEVDVTDLDIGDSIHIGDLAQEGVAFTSAPGQTLVTVVPPRLEEVEEPEVEELLEGELPEGELAEGEEPAEGEGEGEESEEEEE